MAGQSALGDAELGDGNRKRPCVLLADDELSVRRLGERVLQNAGFDVIAAQDGLEALELFRLHHATISIVVLDMTMPGMGGADVFAAMQALDDGVPIVLSTGFHCEDSAAALGGNGPAALVQKPYRAALLVQTLLDVLDQHDGHPRPLKADVVVRSG